MKSSQWRMLVAANLKAKREQELGVRHAEAIGCDPPRFCKDCAHHSCEFDRVKGKIKHYCDTPALLHVITGEKSNPIVNRNTETLCGRAATYFVPRRAAIELRDGTPHGPTTERMDADSRTEIGDHGNVAESETQVQPWSARLDGRLRETAVVLPGVQAPRRRPTKLTD